MGLNTTGDTCQINYPTISGSGSVFVLDPWALPTAINFNRCAVAIARTRVVKMDYPGPGTGDSLAKHQTALRNNPSALSLSADLIDDGTHRRRQRTVWRQLQILLVSL